LRSLNLTSERSLEETVELSGWIQKIRNLGGMVFIDLRDEHGITQVVLNDVTLQEEAKALCTETCIHISGKVVERTSKNPKMPTGDIEVIAEKIEFVKGEKTNADHRSAGEKQQAVRGRGSSGGDQSGAQGRSESHMEGV